MKGYVIISRFPNGQEVSTSPFKKAADAYSMLFSSDMKWLCKCFDVKPRVQDIEVSLWKWIRS